ncbi:Transmembrane BAX inhibitor motif containing [Paragonimus heterotremus]|uniref:Transmembrane BAX inhibitor motif containing n=1 Tax=Paragonimus heterotremus TaxID=100268 RepID=A0A8J4WHB3_9TREM|nr:Transmembrane BAX inhibitor motif containing [Paragonimus heterotremus]
MTTSSVPYSDLESGHPIEKDFAFNNNVANAHVSIRLGFLRKVYGILFTQLMVTVICAGVMFQFKEPLMKAMEYGSFAPLLSVLCALGFLIALMFLKYNTPLNYILLLGFTLSESMAVGFVVVTYSASLVIQAIGLTAVTTFCLMAYAMLSKRDFSQWGAGLFSGLLLLLLAGPINFLLGSSLFELSFALGGAVLFSLLIIYDTHRIMHHCSPEDYIVACIDLYLDILNLFLYLLRILREMQNQ